MLAFGSDWFVAPPTPLEGIYAAVTRRTLDDRNPDGWVPEQKITVEEALRAYTSSAARASFEESRKGTLAAGKLADLVMLDRNIFDMPPEEIRNVHVVTDDCRRQDRVRAIGGHIRRALTRPVTSKPATKTRNHETRSVSSSCFRGCVS